MHLDLAKLGLVFALAVAITGCSDSNDGTESGASGRAGSVGSGGDAGQTAGGSSSAGSSSGGSSNGGSSNGGSSAGRDSSGGTSAGGGGQGGSGAQGGSGGRAGASVMSFFVTSDTSMTGNLGGLVGADMRCQSLAEAVGAGDKTWRAYLSVEQDPDNDDMPTHARDRIGQGPWYNAAGVLLAEDLDSLHARPGDADLFLDENGERIPGQWEGSPAGVEHDVLTGTAQDGTVMPGLTCSDWTSDSPDQSAQVGHSDGLGPNMSTDPAYYTSWQSSHENQSCADTAPRGGAGRIYCFAID